MRLLTKSIEIALVVLLVSVAASGQTEPTQVPQRQVLPFHDGTYVFLNAPRSGSVFEAHIQPNLGWNQLSPSLVLDDLTNKWQVRFSVVGTPAVRLRMFLKEPSIPVRTPSYMPKGTFTVYGVRGEQSKAVGLWAAQLTVGHHSNGQDGCLYKTDTEPVKGTCVGPLDPHQINKKDGSFSTNYWRIGGRYRKEWLAILDSDQQMGKYDLTFGVDFDRHFLTDPRVLPFYGQNRPSFSVSGATFMTKFCKGRVGATYRLKYIGKHADTVEHSWVHEVEGDCTFSDESGWGLFATYYNGQDYYNLGFAQSINRIMFGMHFEDDGFLRFISRRRRNEMKEQKDQRQQRR